MQTLDNLAVIIAMQYRGYPAHKAWGEDFTHISTSPEYRCSGPTQLPENLFSRVEMQLVLSLKLRVGLVVRPLVTTWHCINSSIET